MAEGKEKAKPEYASFAGIMTSILDDCIYNIISDTVLQVHRDEKLRRMETAVILAEQAAGLEPSSQDPPPTPSKATLTPIKTTVPFAGASISPKSNKVHLHGNPLITVPQPHCPNCRLPRLSYPSTGQFSRPPNANVTYCPKQPFIQKVGCDIHGRSLILEKPSKKSKAVLAKEAAAKQAHASGTGSPDDDNTPPLGSQTSFHDGTAPAASPIPSGKCPECQRHMAYTRIAAHMDRCIKTNSRNGGGRLAARGSNTPLEMGSRAGTPKPGSVSMERTGSGLGKGSGASLEKGKKRKFGTSNTTSFGKGKSSEFVDDDEEDEDGNEDDDGEFQADDASADGDFDAVNSASPSPIKKKKFTNPILKGRGGSGASSSPLLSHAKIGNDLSAYKKKKLLLKEKEKGLLNPHLDRVKKADKRPPGLGSVSRKDDGEERDTSDSIKVNGKKAEKWVPDKEGAGATNGITSGAIRKGDGKVKKKAIVHDDDED